MNALRHRIRRGKLRVFCGNDGVVRLRPAGAGAAEGRRRFEEFRERANLYVSPPEHP